MLMFRIETCISLINRSVVIPAGAGPYGTRSMIRVTRVRHTEDIPQQEDEMRRYVTENHLFNFSHTECSMSSHPVPTQDEQLMRSLEASGERVIRGYTFGFDSVERLKNWFSEEALKRLHIAGYYVSIYEVENAHVGSTQSIFMKEDAKLVNFISCLEV